jgi:hypothetical protein
MRVVCGVAGRFEPPKPCGARPESVALPWAFQLRPETGGREPLLFNELVGREPLTLLLKEPFGRELLLLNEPLERAPCDCPAVGGRLDDGCDGRALLNAGAWFPPRPKLPAGLFVPRFADMEPEFNVRTGMWEAAAAGVDRATTLRFCTLAEGVATRPCMLDAPRKLECVGEALMPPATRALRNELAERCVALRLIAWPFTKALCDAVVTAFVLRAYR